MMKTTSFSALLGLLAGLAGASGGSASAADPEAPLRLDRLALLGHARLVCGETSSLWVSPDGAWVGGNGRWFRSADGREGHPVTLPPGAAFERFLSDGAFVVSKDGEYRIFAPGSATPRATIKIEEGLILFDAHGKVCLHVRTKEDHTDFRVARLKPDPSKLTWRALARVKGSIYRVFLSEQGEHLIWKADDDKRIGVIDIGTGRHGELHPDGDADQMIRFLAISPDGRLAACCTDRTVCLFDTRSGKQTRCVELPGNLSFVNLRFTPDGKAVVHASCGSGLRIIPTAADRPVRHLPIRTGDGIFALALLPDARRVALADRFGVIRLHDLHTGKQVDMHTRFHSFHGIQVLGKNTAACWSENGQVVTWDLRDGRVLAEVTIHMPSDSNSDFRGMRFSPDRRYIAGWTEDERCVIAEARSGKPVLVREGCAEAAGVDFPSSKTVAIVRTREAEKVFLEIIDLEGGIAIRSIPLPSQRICFAGDGRTFLRASAGWVALTETATGRDRWAMNLFCPELGKHSSNSLVHAVLGRRGRKAYVVREQDAYVLDAWTGKIETMISVSASGRESGQPAAISGRWLATVRGENLVDLYDLESRRPEIPVASLSCPRAPILAVALDEDGSRLLTAHGDGICQVWDLKRFHRTAAGPGTTDPWELLSRPDPAEAQPALTGLMSRPGPTVTLLAGKLSPADEVPSERIAGWIRQLDAADFKTRELSSRRLRAVLDQAAEQLRAAEKRTPSLEVRRRIRRLLAGEKGPEKDPERLRQLRAVEILERISSPEAKALLEKLARGAPRALLTRDARAALERLRR